MRGGIYWRLSVMMTLQYLIWGSWGDYLPVYLDQLKFSPDQQGLLMGVLYFTALISPFIGGQIADRYLPTEKLLGVAHLLGGIFILVMAQFVTFYAMLLFMFLHSMVYITTLPLTNTLSFHHLDNIEKDFGKIRVWGTLGWIFAGLFLSTILYVTDNGANCLRLAGVSAVLLGIFSFFLPHTPPNKESTNPLAFLEAVKLLKQPSFLIFMVISFFVSTELMFYFLLTGPFLVHLGFQASYIPSIMRIAQAAEIITMVFLLPIILPRIGIKSAMIVGILAWPLRYIIFAIGQPVWLVVASLALHGFCYVFFFVVGQIYVDRAAPADVRSSAQSMLYFITFGLGLLAGSMFAGRIRAIFTSEESTMVNGVQQMVQVTNWTWVFMVPVILTVLCTIFFVFLFHEPREGSTAPTQA